MTSVIVLLRHSKYRATLHMALQIKKLAYLSKAIKLCLMLIPSALISSCSQSRMNILHQHYFTMMQLTFKPVSNYLRKWIDWKCIQQLLHIQCECKQCKLICFQCTLFSQCEQVFSNILQFVCERIKGTKCVWFSTE